MRYKVVVFDFDGTLVQSNGIKREAYYRVFPSTEDYGKRITEVLSEFPELNRYDTIEKIIALMGDGLSVQEIANHYSQVTLEAVINAQELSFACKVLELLHNNGVKLYLSSNTPIEMLETIVRARGLEGYFCDISGFPAHKVDFLKQLIVDGSYKSSDYLVVGDGDSDQYSASVNNVDFFHVNNDSLEKLYEQLSNSGCKCD